MKPPDLFPSSSGRADGSVPPPPSLLCPSPNKRSAAGLAVCVCVHTRARVRNCGRRGKEDQRSPTSLFNGDIRGCSHLWGRKDRWLGVCVKVSRLHPSGPQFFLHMALYHAPVPILPMALLCPLDEVKVLKQGLSQPPASTLATALLQGLFPRVISLCLEQFPYPAPTLYPWVNGNVFLTPYTSETRQLSHSTRTS